MFILAFIWSLFGAIAIAAGLESQSAWNTVFKHKTIAGGIRRILLLAGIAISLATIFLSFYYFVLSNAIIIMGAWVAAFLIARLVMEILKRKDTYADAPAPAPQQHIYAEPQGGASLRDVSDAEEIETNEDVLAHKAHEKFANNVGNPDTHEPLPDLPEAPSISAKETPPPITEPQVGPGEPRSAEYNEIFNRLNK